MSIAYFGHIQIKNTKVNSCKSWRHNELTDYDLFGFGKSCDWPGMFGRLATSSSFALFRRITISVQLNRIDSGLFLLLL